MTTKVKLTKSDREYLVAHGFVEGRKDTIPENISPVLKSQLLAEMDEDDSGSTPGEAGGPDALAERQSRFAEPDANRKPSQPKTGQQSVMASDSGRGKVDNAVGGGKK